MQTRDSETTHARVLLTDQASMVAEAKERGMSVPLLIGAMRRVWLSVSDAQREASILRVAADRVESADAIEIASRKGAATN